MKGLETKYDFPRFVAGKDVEPESNNEITQARIYAGKACDKVREEGYAFKKEFSRSSSQGSSSSSEDIKRSTDTPVLLTKNEMKALKSMVFSISRKLFQIERLDSEFDAVGVNLQSVLVWAIREHHLMSHGNSADSEVIEFNIKIDGRPLGGGTEREILKNMEGIVRKSLPTDKVSKLFQRCERSGEQVILAYVTFFEERRQFAKGILDNGTYIRDYGSYQEPIKIEDAQDLKAYLCELENDWALRHDQLVKFVKEHVVANKQIKPLTKPPKKKRRQKEMPSRDSREEEVQINEKLNNYAAELEVEFFVKVCKDWAGIAQTMRDSVFEKEDEQMIDIHDIKCKEWGFLLKRLFGVHLGTGDYGHLTIDHSTMLLRQFRSMHHYSGQGFESSHKLHRQLFAKATNHDSSGPGQSLDQILTHWYATKTLYIRQLFREAKESLLLSE
ncbi:hypothetical protein QZH41_000324 [Actinostola sp. cb2023]|nr:hypothetical protein QZH41_000324 [Actinostola sp. cb2023]